MNLRVPALGFALVITVGLVAVEPLACVQCVFLPQVLGQIALGCTLVVTVVLVAVEPLACAQLVDVP